MNILKNYKKENRDPEITDVRHAVLYSEAKKYGWEKLDYFELHRKLENIGITSTTLRNRTYRVLQQLVKKGYLTKYIDEKDAFWVKYRLKEEFDSIV